MKTGYFFEMLISFERSIGKAEELIAVIANYAMVAVIVWQVICRYFLMIPTAWAEELARYIFVWLCFIACGIATRENKHIEIDLISTIIESKAADPERVTAALNKVTYIVSIVFLSITTNIYTQYLFQIVRRGQRSPALKVLIAVPMTAALVGFALMIFHYICMLVVPDQYRKKPSTEPERVE
ncbi:TRAP transporter small permease [Synergistaceae bacterium OttesenSCG-928-I11]|nr:TRAP transporter small permease [Synergistaceae bacterium OttesenSCG-928-I11]